MTGNPGGEAFHEPRGSPVTNRTPATRCRTHESTVGVRYEVNYSTYLRFAYTSQWVGLDNADGTPRFDVLALEVGWMF